MEADAIAPATSSTVSLRAYRDADLGEVFRLYEDVFGASFALRFRARFHWAFEQNPLAEHTRRWVLAKGGEVVGFLGALPLAYVVGGERLIAHTPCDFMVAPALRFHGIRLMQEALRVCGSCVSSDDVPATICVTRWLGAEPVGSLVRYMKPLDTRLLEERGVVRPLPRLLHWPISAGLRVAQRARRELARGPARKLVVRDGVGIDERFARLNEALAAITGATVERDLRFFHWRYGPGSPHAHRRLSLLVDDDEELLGYAIHLPPEGPSRVGAILDVQVHPNAPAGAREALLVHAVRRLRRAGAYAVRYDELRASRADVDPLLRRLGFTPRGEQQLLVRMHDERAQEVASRLESWSLRYGDSESSHAFG